MHRTVFTYQQRRPRLAEFSAHIATVVAVLLLVAGTARSSGSVPPELTATDPRLPPAQLEAKRRILRRLEHEAALRREELFEATAATPKTTKLAFVVDKQYRPHIFVVRTARQLWLLTSGSVPGSKAVLVTGRELRPGSKGTWDVSSESVVEVAQPDGSAFKLTATPKVPVYLDVQQRLEAAVRGRRDALAAKAEADRRVELAKREVERLEPAAKTFEAAARAALGGACPTGTQLAGAPPPWGQALGCVRVESETLIRHGPWKEWEAYDLDGEQVTSEEWGRYDQGHKHGVWQAIDGTTGHWRPSVFVDGKEVDTSFLFSWVGACESRRARGKWLKRVDSVSAQLPDDSARSTLLYNFAQTNSLCTEVLLPVASRMAQAESFELIEAHVRELARHDRDGAWRVVQSDRVPAALKARLADVEPDELKRARAERDAEARRQKKRRELRKQRRSLGRWGAPADRLLKLHCQLRDGAYARNVKLTKLMFECDGPKNYRKCSYKRREAVKAELARRRAEFVAWRAGVDAQIKDLGQEVLYESQRLDDAKAGRDAITWVVNMADAKCPLRSVETDGG